MAKHKANNEPSIGPRHRKDDAESERLRPRSSDWKRKLGGAVLAIATTLPLSNSADHAPNALFAESHNTIQPMADPMDNIYAAMLVRKELNDDPSAITPPNDAVAVLDQFPNISSQVRDLLEGAIDTHARRLLTSLSGLYSPQLEQLANQQEVILDQAEEEAAKEALPNFQPRMATEAVQVSKNPQQTIDLEPAKSTKVFIDMNTALQSNETSQTPATIEQIAQLRAGNDDVELIFSDDGSISESSKRAIQEVVHNVSPLTNAAFANRDALTVRIGLGESYDPYYLYPTREVIIILPRGPVSLAELQIGLTHELVHGLTREIFSPNEPEILPQTAQMAQACQMIANTVLNRAEAAMSDLDENLSAWTRAVDPKHRPVVEGFRQAMKQKRLDSQELSPQECDNANDQLRRRIYELAASEGVKPSDISYIFELPEFIPINNRWESVIERQSVLRELREANYVTTTDPADQDGLGHPHTNAAELTASLLNIQINYTQELAGAIARMPNDKQEAVLEAILAAQEAVRYRHLGMTDYFSDLNRQLLLGMAGQR